MMKPFLASVLITLAFFTSCTFSDQKHKKAVTDTIVSVTNWNKSIPGNYSAQTQLHFDSTAIKGFLEKNPNFKPYSDDIYKFYRNRKFAYAWFDSRGIIEQASNLNSRIQHLDDEGLSGKVPYAGKLDTLMLSANSKADVTTELMLTGNYFAFSRIAWQGGVNDKEMKQMEWFMPRKKLDSQKYLEEILSQPSENLISKDPAYRQYDLLKLSLKKYRELAVNDKWEIIKADKKSYRPGDSSAVIQKIRSRLALLGDLKADNASKVYDEELQTAAKQFQFRHGLTDDGVLGPGFFNALNVSPQQRINQLLVNIERSRWVPEKVYGSHLIVNIPSFKLYAFQSDTLDWSCNVVVGKELTKTVVFNGDLKYIVFSPYWNVPPSIIKTEILPGMKKDANYLQNHRMEIAGKQGSLPIIRQLPGPSNSLGLVKFLFPNSYNIYLHDTPSKSLFKEDQRAFSHGCVRVGEPKKLATYLLRNDSTWTDAKITAAMNAGKERTVTLKKPVPVFIAYFTAFVDHNGLLNFRKDIYNRDKRLEEMLFKN